MKKNIIFVPAVCFSVDEDQGGICDVVLQGFFNKSDAKELYPDTEIIEVRIPEEERPQSEFYD